MFDRLLTQIAHQKYRFFGTFFVVVFITYAFFYIIDFIPEAPETVREDTQTVQNDTDTVVAPIATHGTDATPDRLIIEDLDREVAILNPSATSVAALDQALLSGVVRHPGSADLTEEGTMFLFGHSSYLPNVFNSNFQAFNGIQDLEWGDKIRIQSADFEYVYRVDRVYEVKASQADIELGSGTSRLTLVTCNTFGAKEDRFVLEATLVDSYAI